MEVASTTSTLGVVTLAPTREYPFDLVFGPEADQSLIYHEVVHPMLEQVLTGYNCTLFAYGQTGTGKTHTMQGDLVPTAMGNPSQNAGMIPRVLFRLFHQLETSSADYSVKISYVELYNEELRDLLAADLAVPAGSVQPMGKDQQSASNLKIYDDSSKRGVFIQGLEEISVKDSAHALALLIKGSERRQIAATKFNDHSSRSHSIFSVTVHTKEKSSMGEDLLKIGKLNLVDLAGSENIGRSGAENKRAREAGMINQSLLTLGRVINALVDKSPHVPYRESKLTRLLQDSLGGRTKTCIIATVSPARSNLEETLSTLDYAMHAKSIRNKPELNQRMTRNSLIKEYVVEIERLKADLFAAREKNGIFFAEDTWNQMSAEKELKETELAEAKKQVDILDSQMRAVREEFDQSIGLLKKREKELEHTKDTLHSTQLALDNSQINLQSAKDALEEETVARQLFQASEARLDVVATGLKKVAAESVGVVGGLFEKLDRKTASRESMSQAVLTQSRGITSAATSLSQRVADYSIEAGQHDQNIASTLRSFQSKELEALEAQSARIDEQLRRLQEASAACRAHDAIETEAVHSVKDVMQQTHQTLQVEFGTWGDALRKACKEMGSAANNSATIGLNSLETAVSEIARHVDNMVKQTGLWADTLRTAMKHMKEESDKAASDEITRLEKLNESLVKRVASMKAESERGQKELIQSISSSLEIFVKKHDDGLQQMALAAGAGNNDGMKAARVIGNASAEYMATIAEKSNQLVKDMSITGQHTKRTWDGAIKASAHAKEDFGQKITHMQNSITGSVGGYTSQIQKQSASSAASCSQAFDRHDRAKRQRIESNESMVNDINSGYRSQQRSIASTSRAIESASSALQSENSTLAAFTTKFIKGSTSNIQSLQQGSQAIADRVSQPDLPLGTTPRKRVWEYVEDWELAGKRAEPPARTRGAMGPPSMSRTRSFHSSGSFSSLEDHEEETDLDVASESEASRHSSEDPDSTMRIPVKEAALAEPDPETPDYPDFSPASSGSSVGVMPLPSRSLRSRKTPAPEPHPLKTALSQPLVDSRSSNGSSRISRRTRR